MSIGADGRINEWSLKKGLDYLSKYLRKHRLEAFEDRSKPSTQEGRITAKNVQLHKRNEYRFLGP